MTDPYLPRSPGRIQRLYGDILSLLEAELQQAGFVGPVGIDAFVYRTPQGSCRLKPSWKSIPAIPWAA